MRVFLYFVGRPKDRNLNAVAEDYLARCARYVRCEMREVQPARFDLQARHPSAVRILLDPGGALLDSAAFTQLVAKAEMEGRDLVFALGGADGLPASWRAAGDMSLSLSPLTFPHEMARAMLAEQLYRAFTTLRGHPYPR
jgi:23S rRNA (pseudouridine1915-N3)-methyltransferase